MTPRHLEAPRLPATPGAFAAGAEIYRRLERRQRRPSRRMAVLLAVIAVAVSGAAIVLEKTNRADLARNTTPVAARQSVPAATPTPAAPHATTSAARRHHPSSAQRARAV